MRLPRLGTVVIASALALGIAACSDVSDASDDGEGAAAIQKSGESPPWLYEGPMPVLVAPSMVVSITGHTLRVTGTLPDGFDAEKLPFYALRGPKSEDGHQKVSVVYPVATGMKVKGEWNNVPGRYDHLNVRPYRPKDPDQTGKEHWGGFPFLNYHDDRRFALHGPIDYVDDADLDGDGKNDVDWRLTRGRVSKGCQRMQGEHVLELTHLLGFDMTYAHATSENVPDKKNGVEGKWIPASLEVLAEPAVDTIPDPSGAAGDVLLDVAYPKDATVDPLPEGKPVFVAPTWDANDMRAFACAVLAKDNPNLDRKVPRTGGRFDGSYCLRTRGANLRDAKTGDRL